MTSTIDGKIVRYLVLRLCQTFDLPDGSTFTEASYENAIDPEGSLPFYALFAGLEDGDNVLLCDFPAYFQRGQIEPRVGEMASALTNGVCWVED